MLTAFVKEAPAKADFSWYTSTGHAGIRSEFFFSASLAFLLLLLLMCFGGYIILQYRHVYKRDHAAMTSDYAQ